MVKLISCHIENFGKLCDFDMTFDEGLNVIRRDNGWGKSTLAFFLKAMLYGLEGERKRDASGNERKRFCPWQGGVFGGRLTFETGGKRYTVARSFGDTPAKDVFELRDAESNAVSADFSSALGKELFRIDSASFFRTVFIGQSDCPTNSTDDIHAKISNLADDTDDINSFQSAEKLLGDQIRRLSPERSTGLLFRGNETIAALRRKVLDGNELGGAIADKERERAEAEARKARDAGRRAELEILQKKALQAQEMLLVRREHQRLEKARDAAAAELTDSEKRFPSGIPSLSEADEILRAVGRMENSGRLMDSYELTLGEREELTELDGRFGESVPSPGMINERIKDSQRICEHFDRLKEVELTPAGQARMEELRTAFSSEEPDPESMAVVWSERCKKKSALAPKQAMLDRSLSSAEAERTARTRRAVFLGIFGVLLMLLGGALVVTLYQIHWIFLSAAGVILMTAGVIFSVRQRAASIEEFLSEKEIELRRSVRETLFSIAETDGFVEDYLAAHDRSFDEPFVPVMLAEIQGERRELDALEQREEQGRMLREDSGFLETKERVREFLRQYGFSPAGEDATDQLYELGRNAERYGVLCEKRNRYSSAFAEYCTERETVEAFVSPFGTEDGEDLRTSVERIRDDIARSRMLKDRADAAQAELAAFEAENPASGSSQEEALLPSLEEISGELKAISLSIEAQTLRMTDLSAELTGLYEQYDQWEKDCLTLDESLQSQAENQRKYERLVKAREHLVRAKERMTAQYVDPISRAFRKYLGIMEETAADRFKVDADAHVTVEQFGLQRESSLLSAGYRDMTGVCLRIALADAMYPDEKPPLILDDPFTNLDDGRMTASRLLLRSVSETYQVIYFTCSASRE